MNFIKRALLAITRKKVKSIIMFIIFAVIANLVLAGFAIQHATKAASADARKQLGGQLTLTFDRQKAFQKAQSDVTSGQTQSRPRISAVPVTEDMIKLVSKQKNITAYNAIVSPRGGLADSFTAVVEATPTPAPNTNKTVNNMRQNSGNNNQYSNYVQPDVGISGVSATELSDDFNGGGAVLLSGRHIKPEDAGNKVALIEKNLADQNKLVVGSKIKIKGTRSDNEVEYTIIGIYQAGKVTANSDIGAGFTGNTSSDPYNKIFVDYKSAIPLEAVKNDDGTITEGGISSAVFFVDDPQNIDTIKADIKAMKIDWNTYTIDANDAAYQQMVGPIENVASFSLLVILLVGIAGAIIIALILMLSIKERMYETGVLLSMGEAKLKIISQYVAEVLLIAIVAFGLSAFSGNYISQSIGNSLISREIKTEQTEAANASVNSFGGGSGRNMMSAFLNQRRNANVKQIDSISVNIAPKEVEETSSVGLLIIILGTILPSISIMGYKPKTILSKAS